MDYCGRVADENGETYTQAGEECTSQSGTNNDDLRKCSLINLQTIPDFFFKLISSLPPWRCS